MITVWMSKEFLDVIPFDRIICVKDTSQNDKRFLEVILEDRHSITIHPGEVDSFLEAFRAFVEISEAINLGIAPETTKTKKQSP